MRGFSNIEFDPREDESLSEKSVENGIYYCTSCGECSKTCPKEIDIYGKAIEKLRIGDRMDSLTLVTAILHKHSIC